MELTRVNLKQIKKPTQSGSLEQRMTLVKINSCKGFIVSLNVKLSDSQLNKLKNGEKWY